MVCGLARGVFARRSASSSICGPTGRCSDLCVRLYGPSRTPSLAVLFGSTARGDDDARSDVDVLVVLADPSVARLAALAERLSARTDRDVQPVRLGDAESSPLLMADVLEQGRVLVDREGRWPALRAQRERWRRLAASEDRWRLEPMDDLLLGTTAQ